MEMKMDMTPLDPIEIEERNFYRILDLLYQINKKYPELRFGQLMHNLTVKGENLFYMDDEEIIKRIEEFLKDDNEN
jgi:hypothetical protein